MWYVLCSAEGPSTTSPFRILTLIGGKHGVLVGFLEKVTTAADAEVRVGIIYMEGLDEKGVAQAKGQPRRCRAQQKFSVPNRMRRTESQKQNVDWSCVGGNHKWPCVPICRLQLLLLSTQHLGCFSCNLPLPSSQANTHIFPLRNDLFSTQVKELEGLTTLVLLPDDRESLAPGLTIKVDIPMIMAMGLRWACELVHTC